MQIKSVVPGLLFMMTVTSGYAQSYRLALTGGLVTNSAVQYDFNGEQNISAIGGLSLSMIRGWREFGINAQLLTLGTHRRQHHEQQNPYRKYSVLIRDQYAEKAVPLTAFFNYGNHGRNSYAFLGLNAGIIIVRGREPIKQRTISFDQDTVIGHGNGTGYTLGTQLGFRTVMCHFELGLQLQMNYSWTMLEHYSGDNRPYPVLYLPLQISIGYRL